MKGQIAKLMACHQYSKLLQMLYWPELSNSDKSFIKGYLNERKKHGPIQESLPGANWGNYINSVESSSSQK